MTHNAAVQIVVQLAPAIEKSGAEEALLKYAREEDLPPAQLEKLAQTFNTLLTVSHIEKAADRGSAPTGKIDVPVFVASYAIDDRKPATIKTAARATHDPNSVDLMSAIRMDIAGPTLAKAAAAPEPEKAAAKLTRAQLEDVLLDHDLDAMFTMEAIANTFAKTAGALDLAAAEADAMHVRSPQMVKAAIDWLCSVTRKQASRHEGDLRPRAVPVLSDAASQLVVLTDAMAMRQVIKNAAKAVAPSNGPDAALEEPAGQVPEEESDFFGQFAQEDTSDKPGGGFLLSPEQEAAGAADAQSRFDREGGARQGGSGGPPTGGDTKGEGKAQGKDSGGEKGKPDAGRVSRIASVLAAPIKGVGSAVGQGASALDKFLEDVVSKERTNTRQRSNDISLADIRRSINVQRMIGTDPVLREKDPREVLEIYNAVAQSNPEVAGDMARMRLILREATSYDGVTLDSQKQLTDIRKGTAEAEAKESENSKRQYSIGGSAASLLGGKLKA